MLLKYSTNKSSCLGDIESRYPLSEGSIFSVKGKQPLWKVFHKETLPDGGYRLDVAPYHPKRVTQVKLQTMEVE